MSVCRNGRTGALTVASKNNGFRERLLCRNRELAFGCATIAYQVRGGRRFDLGGIRRVGRCSA